MTDTRKDFERAVSNLGWAFDYIGDGQYGSHTIQFANKLWQACQSLNDKRIEQLLAVIAKKDEALSAISDYKLYGGEVEMMQCAEEAIALQPADVELVEVERVRIIDGIPTLCSSKSSAGEPTYTIKKKASTK